jgi:hypothetical protein
VTDSLPEIRPTFNGSLHVECREDRITSDGGAVLLREIEEAAGLCEWMAERLVDPRDPDKLVHPLVELLRTRLYMLVQGRRDQDDADVLRDDPAFRLAVSERRGVAPLQAAAVDENGQKREPEGLASQPTLSRLQTLLSRADSLQVLRDALCEFSVRRILAANGGRKHRSLGIDVDSIPIEVYGQQPGSAYNGHYEARVYHPLMASVAETGDILDVLLREGNVHTANDSLDFILAILDKMKEACLSAFLRIDAGFPEDKLLSAVEGRGARYVARIKNNAVLNRMAEPFNKRPAGRPPKELRIWFYEMTYKAEEWSRARRVVLVVQEKPGELYLHHFWLLTNCSRKRKPGAVLLEMYRERGTAEGHQGEFKDVLAPALSSSPRWKMTYRGQPPSRRTRPVDSFAQNEATLLMNALAYNLAHAGRVMLEKATGQGWSLRRFRERALLVAARITTHGNRITMVITGIARKVWQALWPKLTRASLAAT